MCSVGHAAQRTTRGTRHLDAHESRHLARPPRRHHGIPRAIDDQHRHRERGELFLDRIGEGGAQRRDEGARTGTQVVAHDDAREPERFAWNVGDHARELAEEGPVGRIHRRRVEHEAERMVRRVGDMLDDHLAAEGVANEDRRPDPARVEPAIQRGGERRQIQRRAWRVTPPEPR